MHIKKIALKIHPDKNSNTDAATKAFQELNNAYEFIDTLLQKACTEPQSSDAFSSKRATTTQPSENTKSNKKQSRMIVPVLAHGTNNPALLKGAFDHLQALSLQASSKFMQYYLFYFTPLRSQYTQDVYQLYYEIALLSAFMGKYNQAIEYLYDIVEDNGVFLFSILRNSAAVLLVSLLLDDFYVQKADSFL